MSLKSGRLVFCHHLGRMNICKLFFHENGNNRSIYLSEFARNKNIQEKRSFIFAEPLNMLIPFSILYILLSFDIFYLFYESNFTTS